MATSGNYALSAISEDFFRSNVGATLPDGTTDITENISHNGSVGIGIADPTTNAAMLDVNGAQVLRTIALADFAAIGNIGTAATTVDIASTITIN